MHWNIILKLFGLSILAVMIGFVLYQPVIQPWHTRWGATNAEVKMVLPGDDIVTGEVSLQQRKSGRGYCNLGKDVVGCIATIS